MVDFENKLELRDQKYQTNGNVRDENNNGKFVFTTKEFYVICYRSFVNLLYVNHILKGKY